MDHRTDNPDDSDGGSTCSSQNRKGTPGESGLPEQLVHEPLIRLKRESKEPVEGPRAIEPFEIIQSWIDKGGNVGVALTEDLVVIDVDEEGLREVVEKQLPSTFTVKTGGGGEHRYFRCPGWEDNRKFGNLGSIRTNGWQVAAPPSIHPSGNVYQVADDEPITEIDPTELEELVAYFEDGSSQHTRPARRCVGGSVPSTYPNRSATERTLKAWLESNGLLDALDQTGAPDRSGHEIKLAKCLAEGGFERGAIASVLDQLPSGSKWHERGEKYREQTLMRAIQAAVDDPYVEYGETGDMESTDSESRKMEESRDSGILQGSETMVDYNDHEEVPILEGSNEGESFRKVTRSTGTEDGETFDFISLKRGHLTTEKTKDGEEVLVQRIDDSTSLGSPEYARDLGEGLIELAKEIEESSSEDEELSEQSDDSEQDETPNFDLTAE